MATPTRLTSETGFVLLLDPRFVRVTASAVEYDLAAAAAAGVTSFAGRSGAVEPKVGDYDAVQVSYGESDVAEGLIAAQSSANDAQATADAAQSDAFAAAGAAAAAQADATTALDALAALTTSEVANASGVAGTTASAALDALGADVATRATSAALAAETANRVAADNLLAPLVSPALTGNPTAPTPATSDNDTSVATSAMVQAVAALCVKAFTSGGAVSGTKAWYGTATTDANGDWSVDITPAGFSASPVVLVGGELNTTTVTDQVWATVRTRSSTTIAGTAIRGVVLAVLGATLRRAAAGATVHVLAVGT